MINVTKAFLPPLEEYTAYLQGVWDRGHLTNSGPLVLELEAKLRHQLGVKHLFFVSNGTIALQIAIKALSLKGDILTTPFSYVATTSSIAWEGCNPVFVDIEEDSLCLDPTLLEQSITPQTSAIIATHVYGNPCDVEAIAEIAERHNLPVIYDAAHAFGVEYKGRPLLSYGTVSTISFHATKLFHTVEGGAIVTNDDGLAHKIAYMRNFGHNGPEAFWGVGVNGKNSEFHAAMGLAVLPYVQRIIERRRELSELYDNLLVDSGVTRPAIRSDTKYNYAYYPVLLPSEEKLLNVQARLVANDITPRRYFYPSLSELPYANEYRMMVSEDTSRRVLCLPLYYELSSNEVELIADIINAPNNGTMFVSRTR
jgi:dTDP-4-amino-4,6-dideoxygalactose transaminase